MVQVFDPESDKVIVQNRDEEGSPCLYGLSKEQTDPNSPSDLPDSEQMEAGGELTLVVWTRRVNDFTRPLKEHQGFLL